MVGAAGFVEAFGSTNGGEVQVERYVGDLVPWCIDTWWAWKGRMPRHQHVQRSHPFATNERGRRGIRLQHDACATGSRRKTRFVSTGTGSNRIARDTVLDHVPGIHRRPPRPTSSSLRHRRCARASSFAMDDDARRRRVLLYQRHVRGEGRPFRTTVRPGPPHHDHVLSSLRAFPTSFHRDVRPKPHPHESKRFPSIRRAPFGRRRRSDPCMGWERLRSDGQGSNRDGSRCRMASLKCVGRRVRRGNVRGLCVVVPGAEMRVRS